MDHLLLSAGASHLPKPTNYYIPHQGHSGTKSSRSPTIAAAAGLCLFPCPISSAVLAAATGAKVKVTRYITV
ncbi:unnamed protein product [Lasius platythorax]|uniref:Uncharacterized protein n=2 Tax=Lasius TaxID=488720 RepID=A0A0J7L372_LASNI|nr:hypothetical protein RF55_2600 [Lasius niger]